MHKIRVTEIAKELGLKPKDVLDKAKEIGIQVKSVSSSVDEEVAQKLYNYVVLGEMPKKEEPQKEPPKIEQIDEIPKKENETILLQQEELASKETQESQTQEIEQKPQTEPQIEQKETLASATIQKRRKIVIVKKKRDEVKTPENTEQKTQEEQTESATQPIQPITQEDLTSHLKKKKKVKKPTLAQPKKVNEQKIQLLDRGLESDVEIDESEDEIELLDLHLNEVVPDDEDELEKKKKILEDAKIKIAKKSQFLEQTIRRVGKKKPKKKVEETKESIQGEIEIPEDIRVYEFAELTNRSVGEVIKALFNLGKVITKNDFLDKDDIEILAAEFGLEVKTKSVLDALDYVKSYDEIEDDEEELVTRPPVVTIMGHVDHGKTSLLDRIRNSRVAAGEAGGITQHIGAYMVQKDGKKISFIDTPGHEAFSEMRARGAMVTDIAIIVIAADDGVQPQTKEALAHAKAAEVPIIVALNKMDKPEANPDRVKSQMAELGYTPVDWGGEYEFVPISAKSGMGIEDLLETILIQAELLELKANPNRNAKAVVIESSLEKGKGPVATVIVQNGTLNLGDSVVVDTVYGKVRSMMDDMGRSIKSLGPSEVAQISGLSDVPPAGSILVAFEDDAKAREIAQKRAEYARQKELSKTTKVSIDELSQMVAKGELKSLNLIIRSDVQGSLEAIKGSLEKLKNDEVAINIIHAAVGGITESDINLAATKENSLILGFNVRPTGIVKEKAKTLGVQIKTYSVIYDLLDEIKAVISGMLSPIIEEEPTGQAEVRDTFNIPKVGVVAGCFVVDGVINRGIKARVIRDGVVIYTGNISSLRRFKDDVKEVAKGFECGLMIEGYNDVKVGDVIETFKEVQRKREI